MNRIKEIFYTVSRENKDKKLKALIDKKVSLTEEEVNFIVEKFRQQHEIATYLGIWRLLRESPANTAMRDFCVDSTLKYMNKEIDNFEITPDFFISDKVSSYLYIKYPEVQKELFEKYYDQVTNITLKTSMATVVFLYEEEKGLELLIDLIPYMKHVIRLRSIKSYIVYTGTQNTINYLKQKIAMKDDFMNTYTEILENLIKNGENLCLSANEDGVVC